MILARMRMVKKRKMLMMDIFVIATMLILTKSARDVERPVTEAKVALRVVIQAMIVETRPMTIETPTGVIEKDRTPPPITPCLRSPTMTTRDPSQIVH